MSGPLRAAAFVPVTVLLAACAGFMSSGPGALELRLDEGTRALERGEFARARMALIEVASECESGAHGRDALLLLSTLELDPRNPEADPRRAMYLSARFMGLPGATPEELMLARSLYALALDRAPADSTAVAGPVPIEVPGLALRFALCDRERVVQRTVRLPEVEDPRTGALLDSLRIERDRLMAERQELRTLVDSLSAAVATGRTRVGELEAELERIREILRGGGGGGGGRPRAP